MNKQLLDMLLHQSWMSITGPKIKCTVIHPHTSCMFEIINKMFQVVKKSFKMYIVIYLGLFLIQLKKTKRERRIKQAVQRSVRNLIRSLLFMSSLIGGMKTALCLLNRGGFFLDIKSGMSLPILGSLSIYFQHNSRKAEIVFFTFVRSLRSLYIVMKKRTNISLTNEKQLCFIIIFGIISYIYYDGPKNSKYRNYLQKIWGDSQI